MIFEVRFHCCVGPDCFDTLDFELYSVLYSSELYLDVKQLFGEFIHHCKLVLWMIIDLVYVRCLF